MGAELQSDRESPSVRSVHRRRNLLLSVGLAGILFAAGWFTFRSISSRTDVGLGATTDDFAGTPEGIRDWRSRSQFIGNQACRKCHPDQFESYLETAHSRALEVVVPDHEPPDATFDDLATKRRYRTARIDGQLIHEVSLVLDTGAEVLQSRFPVRYRFGSGHAGRTYMIAAADFLVESPISWFESQRRWGLSPGMEGPDRLPFGRAVPDSCVFCHCGNYERSLVSDFRVRVIEPPIGCERCHGPGRAHVERELADLANEDPTDRRIVNPRRLPRKQAEALCHQCHLQGDLSVPGRGVHAGDFLAGEALETYRHDYLIQKPREAMQVAGHVAQLTGSACYRQGKDLMCVTCHPAHGAIAPEDRVEHYRTVCLTCHGNEDCRLALPRRVDQRQNDCTACHMPRSATDIPHFAMTHHRIGIHPLKEDAPAADGGERLIPLFDTAALSEEDRQRSLGLALRDLLHSPAAHDMTSAAFRETAGRAEQLLTSIPAEFVDAAVAVGLAQLYILLGRPAESEAAARRALDFEVVATEDRIAALAAVASPCFERGRFQEAAGYFSELTRIRRNSLDWLYLAKCEIQLLNFEKAIRALETARRLDPDAVAPCAVLGEIYRAKKDKKGERRIREEINRLTRRGTGTH